MSTMTSTRLRSEQRRNRRWRLLALPAVAALSVAGAGTAVADDPDFLLTVGIPGHESSTGLVDNRPEAGGAQLIDEVRFGLLPQPGQPGARFGAAILSRYDLDTNDLNGDGEDDLIIGAPGSPGTQASDVPGKVVILFGSRNGVLAAGARVLENHAEAGDEFGAALTLSAREDSSGIRDLWVGAPGHDVAGKADAGAVFRYEISTAGVPTYRETITQNHPMLSGSTAEAGDRFGEVLSDGHVVGVPHEDVGTRKDAGVVQFLNIDSETSELIAAPTYTQGVGQFKGAAEAGDRFGAAIRSNVIGVPGEDLGKIKDAGAIQMFDGSLFHQNSAAIPGKAEAGDRFGAALSVGYRIRERTGPSFECNQMSSIAVGVPGEDLGAARNAGSVILMPSGFGPRHLRPGLDYCPPRTFSQGNGLPGKAETGDQLGATMGLQPGDPDDEDSSLDTVLIGVPGEDVGTVKDAGRVLSGTGKSAKGFGFAGGNVAGMRFGTILPS
jgi:hypothetical protein